MKTRNSEQYKKQRKRKFVYSITCDQDVMEEFRKHVGQRNVSRTLESMMEKFNKKIEDNQK